MPRASRKQTQTTLSAEQLGWLAELAERDAVTPADVLRTAFVRYARAEGVAPPSPAETGKETAA
jgi:hypothetical protein